MTSLTNALILAVLLVFGAIAITTAMPEASAQSATTDGLSPALTVVGFVLIASTFVAALKGVRTLVEGL